MKQINRSAFCALTLSLVSASVALAGASNKNGNPYGNGTFFSSDGTFSGIMRGQNLTGVTQFTTFGSSSVTTVINNNIPGVTAIYYAGTAYVGSSQSVIDPASGQISSVFALSGPVPTLGSPQQTSTNANNENSLVNDAFLLHGAFLANLANSYPNQTFSGNGNVTLNDATIGQTNGQGASINANLANYTVGGTNGTVTNGSTPITVVDPTNSAVVGPNVNAVVTTNSKGVVTSAASGTGNANNTVTITTGPAVNGGSANFSITGVRINSQASTYQ
jgi:hypothetical protein